MNLPGISRIYHGGSSASGKGFSPQYPASSVYAASKITVTHDLFQDASLSKSITLFALPAGSILTFARLKPSITFDGVGITEYFLSIGIVGSLQSVLAEYDAESIVVSSTEYAESFCPMSFNYDNSTNIIITARSVGANLDQSIQGTAAVELFYLTKQ